MAGQPSSVGSMNTILGVQVQHPVVRGVDYKPPLNQVQSHPQLIQLSFQLHFMCIK